MVLQVYNNSLRKNKNMAGGTEIFYRGMVSVLSMSCFFIDRGCRSNVLRIQCHNRGSADIRIGNGDVRSAKIVILANLAQMGRK